MEIWKDITGYEGIYQINKLGNIKSLSRYVKGKGISNKLLKERILKPSLNSDGYFQLTMNKKNVKKNATLHRLLATAFIPNPDNLLLIEHINDVKTDNRLENLKWSTSTENMKSAVKNGRTLKGEKNPASKLTEVFVLEIRANTTLTHKKLGIIYGVDKSIIGDVKNRKTWKHV